MKKQKPKSKMRNDFAFCRAAVRRGGYAALAMTLVVLAASLTVVGGLTFFSLQEVAVNRAFLKSVDSRVIAESGVEDALWRVVSGKQIGASETLGVGKGATTITVVTAGNTRTIRSAANLENHRQNIESVVELTAEGSSFFYGAQVGNGGVEMKNTSSISGSIYSNGPIVGVNSPTITGDALAAGTSAITGDLTIGGNAYAYRIAGDSEIAVAGAASSATEIDEVTIGKSGAADTFDDSTVTQNAYYKTSVSADTVVLGSKIQVAQSPAQLAAVAMPISDAELDQRETEAAAGGTYSSPCPYVINSGAVTIGPKKIACDMDIGGTAAVTLTGTLWIAGNLTIQNSAIVRLDSSYGGLSGLILADDPANRATKGVVSVKNSAQILGSGTPGSYVMVVSRNNSAEGGGGIDAIDIQNTSTASIYYASHGSISIKNYFANCCSWRCRNSLS